jgi:cyclic beta-1,2-glucan synthetase
MYRTGVEGILGINLSGNLLKVSPAIPKTWNGFEFTLKFGTSRYRVEIENRRGGERTAMQATLDGQPLSGDTCEFTLVDDGRYHYAKVRLGG